jgi:phosphoribosylformylglycinamidine synthase
MATVRIIITLKPGILDASGQAVRQGLHALGYAQVAEVRMGRYVEITVPDGTPPETVRRMCERFLANPLIETWRFEAGPPPPATPPPKRVARPEKGAGAVEH